MNFEVKFTSPVSYKLKLAQTCSVRKDEVVFFKPEGSWFVKSYINVSNYYHILDSISKKNLLRIQS